MPVDDLVINFCIRKTLGRDLSLRLHQCRFAGLGRVVRVLAGHRLHVLDGRRLLCPIRARIRTATGGKGAQREYLGREHHVASKCAVSHKTIPDSFAKCNRKPVPVEGLAATPGCD